MKTFRYKGISPDGVSTSGVVKAYDEFEAVSQLRENHTVITKIEAVRETKGLDTSLGGIKDRELALMCSQFSIILASGLPIVRCVQTVAAQLRNKQLRRELEQVAEDMAAGFTMAQSFAKNMPKLPATFIQTVRAGESSGTLELCFQRLYRLFDRSAKTKAKVVSALAYPAIVVSVAIVVMIVIMVVAVPMFTDVFRQMGVELPGITRALIGISDFLSRDGWILVILTAGAAIGYLLLKRSEQGRRLLSEYALKRSPFRTIHTMRNCAQFADSMATVLMAGLSIPKALEITASVVPNFAFGQGIRQVLRSVQQGHTVTESMVKVAYFPPMLTEMTGVGEQAGNLEATLNLLGDYYNSQAQLASQRLLGLLEPVITVVLAVFTVILLLAVYLPMFRMYGAVI